MTELSVVHDTFVIKRTFNASTERVFRAFSESDAKSQWFGGGEGWVQLERTMDFRVGGKEINSGQPSEGPTFTFDCTYFDIVTNERIVYTYELLMDKTRMSVSLATIEFKTQGDKTDLVLTEQGAYLDGSDKPSNRHEGTEDLMNRLDAALEKGLI